MFSFQDLYLQTTNPHLTVSQLFSAKVLLAILISDIFHTVLYVLFFNLVSYVFLGRILESDVNMRLIVALFVIMFLGYVGRVWHVKQVYAAYGGDDAKTRAFVDVHYNSWVFLG